MKYFGSTIAAICATLGAVHATEGEVDYYNLSGNVWLEAEIDELDST